MTKYLSIIQIIIHEYFSYVSVLLRTVSVFRSIHFEERPWYGRSSSKKKRYSRKEMKLYAEETIAADRAR